MTDAQRAPAPPETDAALLSRLGDDAAKWAAEFRATAMRLGYSDMDEDWLIGWFANAIEHSHQTRTSRAPAPPADVEALVKELRVDAEDRAKAHRLATDMRWGSNYMSTTPEQTLAWRAAHALVRIARERDEALKLNEILKENVTTMAGYSNRHQERAEAAEARIVELESALADAEKRFATLREAYDRERRRPVQLVGSDAILNKGKQT